jgi:hypothetical protein
VEPDVPIGFSFVAVPSQPDEDIGLHQREK